MLTYDVQGQGRSDTFGEGADTFEGVPSQQGRPFYDGTEDAIDFMLSTPQDPYRPRRELHHRRRATPASTTAASPTASPPPTTRLWDMLDPDRIGIAGHSLGASGVSNIGQTDPRVDTIVAWDNLRIPGAGGSGVGVPGCASGSSDRSVPPITKPALGFSNDYGLTPTPYSNDPDPQGPNAAFLAYEAAGVDAMQVNIRGGTHYEYSYIPGRRVRRDAARPGHGDLVHGGVVRQVPQDRPVGRPAPADDALDGGPARGPDRPRGRRQPLLVLPALALRLRADDGRARVVRRHAKQLPGDAARRLRAGQLLLSRGGAHPRRSRGAARMSAPGRGGAHASSSSSASAARTAFSAVPKGTPCAAAAAATSCAGARAATASRAAGAPTASTAGPTPTTSAAVPAATGSTRATRVADSVRCGPGRDRAKVDRA